MNIYYPQFQNPAGWDNINDGHKYLHGTVYQMLHRHVANSGAAHPPASVQFSLEDDDSGELVDPDKVFINGISTSFVSESGVISMSVPYGKSFKLAIAKDGYKQLQARLASSTLDGSTLRIAPKYVSIVFQTIDSVTKQAAYPDEIFVDGTSIMFETYQDQVMVTLEYGVQFQLKLVKSQYAAYDGTFTTASLKDQTLELVREHATVTFRCVSSKTGDAVDPDEIQINGNDVEFTSSNGNVTLDVPYNAEFQIAIIKSHYVVLESTCSSTTIDSSSQALTPEQESEDEQESKVSWNHSVAKDLDLHLLVHDQSGSKLTEVYYSNKTFSNGVLSAQIDIDDTGSKSGETLTLVWLDPEAAKAYTYTLVLYDYTNGNSTTSTAMSNSSAKFVVTQDNVPQEIIIPENTPGVFWNVYQIKNGELNVINTVTTANDYGITARS